MIVDGIALYDAIEKFLTLNSGDSLDELLFNQLRRKGWVV